MSITVVPWILALLTAVGFGWIALRAGRSATLWALAGGFFALILTTVVWGLGEAADNPFSDHDIAVFHLRWTAESAAIVLISGAILAWCLRSPAEPGPKTPEQK